jgi:alkaline phosphatase D
MTDVSRRTLLKGGMVAGSLAAMPAEALAAAPETDKPLTRIAFGSCAKQDKDQPIWDQVNGWSPELFVFLGDNIYADTDDMSVMKAKYAKLAGKPGFKELRRKTPCIAIWDDHDYGRNDAGREYPMKKESKDIFMEFWQEPADSERRTREGNQMAYIYGPPGKRVQVILPDNRWWRSGLMGMTETPKDRGPYLTNSDPDAVMLGWEQWQWLQEELEKPAEIRIFDASACGQARLGNLGAVPGRAAASVRPCPLHRHDRFLLHLGRHPLLRAVAAERQCALSLLGPDVLRSHRNLALSCTQ